jgi:hypothetical protein
MGSGGVVDEPRRRAADQVEAQKAQVPGRVLDVVSEDPEIEQVAAQVRPAAVQELIGDQCQPGGDCLEAAGQVRLAAQNHRNETEAMHEARKGHAVARGMQEEGGERRRDQAPGDPGPFDYLPARVVVEW